MSIDYEILVRFLLAALWGGLVGTEREYHNKSAGFRTMIMISVGSCFFTMMSEVIGEVANADRIAANVVTGIGFLGAGVIFRGENRVNGITTAATIWVVAAVGMGIGAGRYFASASASILVLLVLAVLPYVENIIGRLNQARIYKIQYTDQENARVAIEQLLTRANLKFRLTGEIKRGDHLDQHWQVSGKAKNHDLFIAALKKMDK